jgi:hypothetical protein
MSSYSWSPLESSGGVSSLNGMTGALTLTAGAGISIINSIGTITISSTSVGDVTLTPFGTTPSAAGASLTGQALTLQPADATNPGGVSTTAQSFAGNKTFTGSVTASNISGTNTGDVTIGTANGLLLIGQVLSLGLSSTSTTGALSSTDWNTFNNKQNALTLGNLTAAGVDGITVTNGTGAVIGIGSSVQQQAATTTLNGYLTSTDWNTFNSKQAAGNYITALTGDATATGPGSVALTLATVNGNVGSFGLADSVSTITVNAKGLITTASNTSIQITESQVTNLVSDLAGKQPTGNYITALTGDATASGPGSAALTLATVNGNIGSFGSSTAIPSFTVNGKGLITAASTNAVIAPAGTLSGTTLAATVVSSSLASVGTITTGVWNGTAVDVPHGGTGNTSLTAYAVLCGGTTSTSTVQSVASVGTSGQALISNGAGALPTFQTVVAAGLGTTITKSADYAITNGDGFGEIYVTTGGTTRTITLPVAASNTNRIITIKKADTGTGYVTIDGNGSETIDGTLTKTLAQQYEFITMVCDGTNWLITAFGLGTYLISSRLFSAGLSLTTATITNILATPMTIDIPGEWELRGAVGFEAGTSSVVNFESAAISQTSATFPSTDTISVPNSSGEITVSRSGSHTFSDQDCLELPVSKVVVTSSNTFYLIAQINWVTSTMLGFGSITARRIKP